MNTLIIYDNTGYIISQTGGAVREPQGGVQFMWTIVPEGKRLVNIDTTLTPHKANLEDNPLTETELLKQQIEQQNKAISDLTMMIAMSQTPSV